MAANVNSQVVSTSNKILQGSGKVLVNGVDIGGYEGGVTVDYAQTEVWVESDWQKGKVDGEIKTCALQVKTSMEEATLINLAIAYGINTSSVSSVHVSSSQILQLTPPNSMEQVSLVFQGMSGAAAGLGDRTKIRTITITKAVRVGTTGVTLNRGIKTVIPVTFECLMTNGNFGSVVDAVA